MDPIAASLPDMASVSPAGSREFDSLVKQMGTWLDSDKVWKAQLHKRVGGKKIPYRVWGVLIEKILAVSGIEIPFSRISRELANVDIANLIFSYASEQGSRAVAPVDILRYISEQLKATPKDTLVDGLVTVGEFVANRLVWALGVEKVGAAMGKVMLQFKMERKYHEYFEDLMKYFDPTGPPTPIGSALPRFK